MADSVHSCHMFDCKVTTDQTWWWLVFKSCCFLSLSLSLSICFSVECKPTQTYLRVRINTYMLFVYHLVYLLSSNIIKLMNDMEKTPLLCTESISMCAIYFAIFRWLNVGVNSANELRWMEMYKQKSTHAHSKSSSIRPPSRSLSLSHSFSLSVEYFALFS